MTICTRFIQALLVALFLGASWPSQAAEAVLGKSEAVWYPGGVDQAFELAKSSNRLVFMYWGATWCPPCNRLKNAVLSRPRFGKLMQAFVPVYLDGDDPMAQKWGETFSAVGYPTLLILDSNRNELTRIPGNVTLDEFEYAIAPFVDDAGTIEELIKHAVAGKASPEQWQRLVNLDWLYALSKMNNKQAEQQCEKLLSQLPNASTVVMSQFYAQLLSQNAIRCGANAERKTAWVSAIFRNEKTIKANKHFINHQVIPTLEELKIEAGNASYYSLKKMWLKAAKVIMESEEFPLDIRLSSLNAKVDFAIKEENTKAITETIEKVKIIYESLSKNISNSFEAHFVVTIGSDLLRSLRDYAGARKILLDALPTSKTPWYLESKLAKLAKLEKNIPQALSWAKKARESARGRATKLQWIQQEIELILENYAPDLEARLITLVQSYYQTAMGLKDGFSGRNMLRQKALAEKLKQLALKVPKLGDAVKKVANQCSEPACQAHFSSFGFQKVRKG